MRPRWAAGARLYTQGGALRFGAVASLLAVCGATLLLLTSSKSSTRTVVDRSSRLAFGAFKVVPNSQPRWLLQDLISRLITDGY